jgi:hypothetical protein
MTEVSLWAGCYLFRPRPISAAQPLIFDPQVLTIRFPGLDVKGGPVALFPVRKT